MRHGPGEATGRILCEVFPLGGAMKKPVLIIAFLIECFGTLYVAFVTWLLSDWFITDSLAFRLNTAGWIRIGGIRLVYALAVAGVASLLIYLVNRFVLERFAPPSLPRKLHWYAGGVIAVAGLIGVIRFVVGRPYM